MASPRPYRTFYSDGTHGNSSTAHNASLRAFRKVLEGSCKRAIVTNGTDDPILSVDKHYTVVTVTVHRAKSFK